MRLLRFIKCWFKRTGEPDPEAFLDDLRGANVGDWSRMDRYREFRAVFLGHSTPDQGRRVLWQILAWAHMYRPVAAKGDPYMTYFRDGERNIGLKIMISMNAEPSTERPERALNEEPDEE